MHEATHCRIFLAIKILVSSSFVARPKHQPQSPKKQSWFHSDWEVHSKLQQKHVWYSVNENVYFSHKGLNPAMLWILPP